MKILTFLTAAALTTAFAGEALAQPVAGIPSYRPKVDASIEFPDAEDAIREQGAFITPQNVVMVTPGMKKSQIYTLLDVPHFSEGFGVKRWNYILNFYTGQGDQYVACQYQIRFTKGRIDQTYFRDPECAALLDQLLAPPPPKVVQAPPPAPAPAPIVIDYTKPAETFNFTFAFDSAQVGPQGRAVLQQAAAAVRAGHFREVIVTGFTDTSGSVEYNDALAARRAAAAANILRGQVGQVPVYSRASRDLAVPTGADAKEQMNRRVQIELYAAAIDRPAPTTIR